MGILDFEETYGSIPLKRRVFLGLVNYKQYLIELFVISIL